MDRAFLAIGTCAVVLVAASGAPALAQLQLGSIVGVVFGPDGRPVQAAHVVLLDALGEPVASGRADDHGRFALRGIGSGSYYLKAETDSLQSPSRRLRIGAGLPIEVTLQLGPRSNEALDVTGLDGSPGIRVAFAGDAVRRLASDHPTRALQAAIATAPGWSAEDNGLLHARGVDDGFLYVIDGVPVYERLDPLFGLAPDASTVSSVQVLSGYIAPEYGLRSGGVIEVRSVAGAETGWTGSADVGFSTNRAGAVSGVGRGPLGPSVVALLSMAGERSSRFLDPVHPANLHNQGGSGSGQADVRWSPGRDLVVLRGGAGRSRFDVPHGDEQEEAGQDQRERVDQAFATLSWQRTWSSRTVSHTAFYGRSGETRLSPSALDVPLEVHAEHQHDRFGLLAAVSHAVGAHTLRGGVEIARLGLRERFGFAVTDPDEANEADLSPAALAFTPDRPFAFAASAGRWQYSVYVQDSWRPSARLTVELGARYDHTALLLDEQQLSPRVGASYRLGGSTVVRASLNRFYQPPQTEYLLLSSSPVARALSPLAPDGAGGADIRAERQTAFELGIERWIGGKVRVDVAGWHRQIRNQADPNVLFGTTILFPNSVARGRATGLDMRAEMPRRHGWTAFLGYTLSRVVQFGPINGGLFLTDDVLAIGPRTRFTPDHDQRHVGSAGIGYQHPGGRWETSVSARYGSGTPLEVGGDALDELAGRPGSERVDLARGRVRPHLVLDVRMAARLAKKGPFVVEAVAALDNVTDAAYAFNFGNPFSGTHFGEPRTLFLGLRLGR